MKLKIKPQPKHGETEILKKFLFKPLALPLPDRFGTIEKRWLEWANIKWRYFDLSSSRIKHRGWEMVEWAK